MGGFAWVTLATNDSYALGALVLAHSLRRAGTAHDLVALITPGVSSSMRNQLSSVFTLIQEVNVLDSRDEAHLALLERPDLGVTFTKLHCWRLTQYEKCVFLDADTLVLKNSDELFEREELSAAPDPGWPDCFNSGVFVYRPSLDTFNALIKFALSKGSFDGGDQGLLNLFFSDWATKDISRHLPFIYNMVSTATYSYLPAYKQFGENAKIVHFIGANKPWLQYFDSETRLVRSPAGAEHMHPLLQLWWDIFCSTVHPALSPEMLGLAGALAQLTLGTPRSAEQAAFEEHMRKQAWEQGTMDYMGRDSFDNIWRKISETLGEAPPKQEPEIPEVPPTKPASEPKLPESNVLEPKPRKSPPADSKEEPGLTTATVEPTPTHQSSKGSETPSDTIPPGPTPPAEEIKTAPVVPHTPLIIEATPPTSPPIIVPTAPIADIQALKVDAPPPETPPVVSVASKLVSTTEPTIAQTAKPITPADTVPDPVTESSELEQPVVIEQKKSAETIEAPSQDIPLTKEVTPTEMPISLEDEKVDGSTAPELPPAPQAPVPKETPVTLCDEQIGSTVATQVSTPKETPVPTDEIKVLSSQVPTPVQATEPQTPLPTGEDKVVHSAVPEISPTSQISAPKETLESKEDEKRLDSTVPELKSPQKSEPKEIPISPGDEKVVGSTVPEMQSSAPDKTPTSTGDDKVVSSIVPEVLPSSQVSVPEITSESVTSATVVGSAVSEVSSPSQVSAPKDSSIPVADDKVVSSPVSQIPPAPLVSAPQETPSTVADKKVVSPIAPEKPVTPVLQESVPKEVAAVPDVKPLQVSPPKDISKPEAVKEPSSAPIVTEVKQASAPPPPPPPTVKVATPLAGPPSPTQPSAPKEEEKATADVPQEPPKEIPIKPAAPTLPQSPTTPQIPISVPEPAKPELPASPPVVPAEASKTPSGEKLDSKEKQVSEESKPVPAATSPTKTKSAGKKPAESKEPPVSPPQTPDAPPSDQAPVPPKRRGHKGATGAAPPTDQGAASKPTQPQSQQTKGSKPGQKAKK